MTPIWPLLPVETGSLIFQKIISHEPQKIFLQSLHHLKDLSLYYISYTDMTLIWPLLPVENGRLREKKYSAVLFCMHPVRAQTAISPGPTHTYRLCTHTARGSSLQSSRTPNWPPYVHVAVYSLLSSRIQHHGCEFYRETWEIHICNVQTNL